MSADTFQAIILSIRPILFHLVQRKIREIRGDIPPPQKCPADLVHLTGICRDAATRSLQILSELQKQNIICEHTIMKKSTIYSRTDNTITTTATFGFFDLDAAFSASFIFVIDGIISSPRQGTRPSRIDDAYQTVQYLATLGNEAAVKRASYIEEMCAVIWLSADSPFEASISSHYPELSHQNEVDRESHHRVSDVQPQGSSSSSYIPSPRRRQMHLPNAGSLTPQGAETLDTESNTQTTTNSNSIEMVTISPRNISLYPQSQSMQQSDAVNHDFRPLTLDPESISYDSDLFDMYHDPDLPLTGVDSSDWAELERLIHEFREGSARV